MDDGRLDSDAPGADEDRAPAATDDQQWRTWSNLWQVPTILLSLVFIVMALRAAMVSAPTDDFAGVLDQVEQKIEADELTAAGDLLRDVLEPNIDRAESAEKARFHAAVADWTALVQREERVDVTGNNERIDEHYTLARELDLALDETRMQRWIDALISLGRIDDARQRLAELNGFSGGLQPVGESRRRRAELFHRLIARASTMDAYAPDRVLQWLQEYRNDRQTRIDEQLWAIARQAELRLNFGETRTAVDQLLVDMRRIEYAAEPGEHLDFAELYTLLGRGYHALGEDAQAQGYLDQALSRLDQERRTTDPVRGEALVISGRIAVAAGEHDRAFEAFDTVLREFIDTRSYLPALLGRAEVSSILGSHDDAQEDYARLAELLEESGPRRELSPRRVGASLIDRHDAALALGELPLAAEYALLAERFFPRDGVPTDVLHRIAATSKQIGENILAEAGGFEQADVDTRHESNLMFERAATYFVRHARAATALPGSDDRWAESLWNAADCFDLAGLYDAAIAHFEEYMAGRSEADPRRGDVTFRLAQCHHALMQYETAAHFYEQVIRDHPRSINATRSHVPLARCYMALDRRPEAEQQLREVLAGHHAVQPDAIDFRNALIELGTMLYNAGRYVSAIEHLDEAVRRYGDDDRRLTVVFRLADSYRFLAMNLYDEIREPSTKSPGERRRLDDQRREYLTRAMDYFDRICTDYAHSELQHFSSLEVDLLRAAFIHRADCAYHLELHEQAIVMYDEAARRYSEHHSSMHALIQIVNSYTELGDEGRAAAAHRRALVRLRQLGDDAFDAPDALMDRQAWERWLDNTPISPARSASAAES